MNTMKEVAGYLPGLAPTDLQWQTLRFDNRGERLEVAVPVLTEAQIAELATRVRAASRRVLQSMTVSDIVQVLDRAVARLLDTQDPYRQKAERLLPLVTGYDAEMVRLGLTGYLKTFRQPQLQRFLVEDFGNPLLLDAFQPRATGGFTRAYGAELSVHVWAGNVPGLPLWSLISSLLVKSGTVGKLASAEPLFAGWFAQLLVEVEPALADCLAVVWWKGGDEAQEKAFFRQADVVLAYGGNTSLEKMRDLVPITTRFLPHGHKLSLGMVSRQALDARQALKTAQLAAHDVMRYDQQGCYSPHLFYVERGGKISPEDFSRYLANELACFEQKYPRRELTLTETVSLAQWRQTEELKSVSVSGMDVSGEGGWTVVYCDALQELAPSGLDRTVRVVAVADLAQVIPLITPHRTLLQTVGLAAAPRELFALANLLGAAGVTRICAVGQMTAPQAGWHHDGRFSLLDLVQMVDIDASAEAASEAFASYVD